MRQLELHHHINEILNSMPGSVSVAELNEILDTNEDARAYFFNQADDNWLEFLWEHKFLEVLQHSNQKSGIYSVPEVSYISKVAGNKPDIVARIILETPVSDGINNIIINQFIKACEKMPVETLRPIIEKMAKENWVRLQKDMPWGLDYEILLKKLIEAKEFDTIAILVGMLFSVRSLNDKENSWREIWFYLKDTNQVRYLEILLKIDPENIEPVLLIFLQKYNEIISHLSEKQKAKLSSDKGEQELESIFEFDDSYSMMRNFITLNEYNTKSFDSSDELRLVAAIKSILKKYLAYCIAQSDIEAKTKLEMLLNQMPKSKNIFRLRLSLWREFPDKFKDDIEEVLFKLFEIQNPFEIFCNEYEVLLKENFSKMNPEKKEKYKHMAFDFFESAPIGESGENKKYRAIAWEVFSLIYDSLTPEEREKARKLVKFDLNPQTNPLEDNSVRTWTGRVGDSTPYSDEEFSKKSVKDIVEIIKTIELDPKNFGEPNIEGLRVTLSGDVKKRVDEYLQDFEMFFDPEKIDPNYSFAFLSGIRDAIKDFPVKEKRDILETNIITLLEAIKKADEAGILPPDITERRKKYNPYQGWIVGWEAVINTSIELLREVLRAGLQEKIKLDFEQNRIRFLDLIKYFLKNPDPDELRENTQNKNDKNYLAEGLISIAINSIRGKTLETLIFFLYLDQKKAAKNDDLTIAEDIRAVLLEHLNPKSEPVLAIRVLYGQYLASLYARDKKWIKSIMPLIFPIGENDDYFFAAWGGYLKQNVYADLLQEVRVYYEYAIANTESYSVKKKLEGLDIDLANHLAIAFMYGFLEMNDRLIQSFFSTLNVKARGEFVKFIGFRSVRPKEFDFKKAKIDKNRLMKFWEWRLDKSADIEEIMEFGHWINQDDPNVFETDWYTTQIRRTLEITNGGLRSEFDIVEVVPIFAKKSPENAVEILRLFLMRISEQHHYIYHFEESLMPALELLLKKPETKAKIEELSDKLIERGYWEVKKLFE